jgi:DNA-binding NarL/FixJ family response regulator
MCIRILIADDHGVLRAGLRALLSSEADLEVVGEAVDGQETIRLTREFKPDMVLLDISLPDQSGIEVTRSLKELQPGIRVLILTVHEDEGLLHEAIQAGAAGYIIKRAVESELIDAIRAVSRGDIYVHPAMTRALFKDMTPIPPTKDSPIEAPTPREIDVLRYIAQGYTNRQTAEALNISVRTVESHRANLMSKLGLKSRVEVVRYAKDNGYIE